MYCHEFSSCCIIPLQLSIEFALALLPRAERRRRDVLPQLPHRKGCRLVLPRAGAGEELLIVLPLGLCDSKLYSVTVLPSKALRVFDDLQQSLVLFTMTVRHSVFLAMSVDEAPLLRFVWLKRSQQKSAKPRAPLDAKSS